MPPPHPCKPKRICVFTDTGCRRQNKIAHDGTQKIVSSCVQGANDPVQSEGGKVHRVDVALSSANRKTGSLFWLIYADWLPPSRYPWVPTDYLVHVCAGLQRRSSLRAVPFVPLPEKCVQCNASNVSDVFHRLQFTPDILPGPRGLANELTKTSFQM